MPTLVVEFHTIEELRPENGREIVYLKSTYSFDFRYVGFKFTEVAYDWQDDGGTQYVFESMDDFGGDPNYKLQTMLEESYADPKTLWCYQEDFGKALEKMGALDA